MRVIRDFARRRVRLTDERLNHILEHPEMRGMESELAIALNEPELVLQSATDEQVLLSYRFLSDTMVGGKWLCVVVKYNDDDAFVITAYLTDKPKKGRQVWPGE